MWLRQCRSRQLRSDRRRAGPGQWDLSNAGGNSWGWPTWSRQYQVGNLGTSNIGIGLTGGYQTGIGGQFGAGNLGLFNSGASGSSTRFGNFGLFNSSSNTGVGNAGTGSTGLFSTDGSFPV